LVGVATHDATSTAGRGPTRDPKLPADTVNQLLFSRQRPRFPGGARPIARCGSRHPTSRFGVDERFPQAAHDRARRARRVLPCCIRACPANLYQTPKLMPTRIAH
jgi:hypothetical protein